MYLEDMQGAHYCLLCLYLRLIVQDLLASSSKSLYYLEFMCFFCIILKLLSQTNSSNERSTSCTFT